MVRSFRFRRAFSVPYHSRYLDLGMGVFRSGEGVVTGAELIRAAVEQSLDVERTRQIRYILIDFSAATGFEVSSDAIHRIIEANRHSLKINPRITLAIVAPTQLAFGMARMWISLVEDLGVTATTFRERAAAVAWLRLKVGAELNGPNSFPDLK